MNDSNDVNRMCCACPNLKIFHHELCIEPSFLLLLYLHTPSFNKFTKPSLGVYFFIDRFIAVGL